MSDSNRYDEFVVPRWVIVELEKYASQLCNGDKMSDDQRRDMGTRIRDLLQSHAERILTP